MTGASTSAPMTFCSEACRAAEEPLFATATRADVWLLLEYTGRWGTKAFDESALPRRVHDHLARLEASRPHARIQLIKRAPPYEPDPVQFFVAVAHAAEPRLYRFDLGRYSDLLDIDVEAVIAGDARFDSHRVDGPMMLVCTNGLRDACCAKFGLEIYNELIDLTDGPVWQTTHLGGHRFAPIMLVLPHGLHYGRVEVEDLPALVGATARGEILPRRYRGRTIYERSVQAAEHFIREATGDVRVGALRLLGSEATGSGEWSVRMAEAASGTVHEVRVVGEPYPELILKSCSAAEPEPVEHFRVVAHAVENAV